jgi:hypothetical protein
MLPCCRRTVPYPIDIRADILRLWNLLNEAAWPTQKVVSAEEGRMLPSLDIFRLDAALDVTVPLRPRNPPMHCLKEEYSEESENDHWIDQGTT